MKNTTDNAQLVGEFSDHPTDTIDGTVQLDEAATLTGREPSSGA